MTFHILNGDSLAEQFPKEIPGEKIMFRECLIDGPVYAHTEEEFWKIRKAFIEKHYGEKDYISFSKAEILRITQIPRGAKVYLWFEEDLFCQLNLWKAITLLPDSLEEAHLVLPGNSSPYSFAHLTSKQLLDQLNQATVLDSSDFEAFGKLWAYFQKEEPDQALEISESLPEKFSFLVPAIQAWKAMIPSKDSAGLPFETLKEIQAAHPDWGFGKTFQEFQRRLPIYGFGDLQVHRFWEGIKKGD